MFFLVDFFSELDCYLMYRSFDNDFEMLRCLIVTRYVTVLLSSAYLSVSTSSDLSWRP